MPPQKKAPTWLAELPTAEFIELADDPRGLRALDKAIGAGTTPKHFVDLGADVDRLLEVLQASSPGGEEAWPQAAVDGAGGARLAAGAWIHEARRVQELAQQLQHAWEAATSARGGDESARETLHALVRLYEHASAGERPVLVRRRADPRRPTQAEVHAHRLRIHGESERLRRGLQLWQQRVLLGALHHKESGLLSPDPDERRASFWDLRDVFITGDGGVHLATTEELTELFVPQLIRKEHTTLAAVLLGVVAAEMGRNDREPAELSATMRARLATIGDEFTDVLKESELSARIGLALTAIRTDFAGDELLSLVPPAAREHLRAALMGDEEAYRRGADLAIELCKDLR